MIATTSLNPVLLSPWCWVAKLATSSESNGAKVANLATWRHIGVARLATSSETTAELVARLATSLVKVLKTKEILNLSGGQIIYSTKSTLRANGEKAFYKQQQQLTPPYQPAKQSCGPCNLFEHLGGASMPGPSWFGWGRNAGGLCLNRFRIVGTTVETFGTLLFLVGFGLSFPSAAAASGWEAAGASAWGSSGVAAKPLGSVSGSVRGPEASLKWSAPSRRMGAFDVIRDLVRGAESPRAGYDAIHHAARRLPSKRPSEMTLAEILAWIDATPGQHHAIGLYQIIPDTLRRLMRDYGISGGAVFSPKTQDALGRVLMEDAGLSAFEAGVLPLGEFADALARVWAGLPMASGRSAYHGIAGNRATITRASFEAALGAASSGSTAPSKGEWREVSSWQ